MPQIRSYRLRLSNYSNDPPSSNTTLFKHYIAPIPGKMEPYIETTLFAVGIFVILVGIIRLIDKLSEPAVRAAEEVRGRVWGVVLERLPGRGEGLALM